MFLSLMRVLLSPALRNVRNHPTESFLPQPTHRIQINLVLDGDQVVLDGPGVTVDLVFHISALPNNRIDFLLAPKENRHSTIHD